MECVLSGLTEEQCLMYVEVIVVFSKSFKEHVEKLNNVFQALRQACLTLRFNKCDFAQKEEKYLVHLVFGARVYPVFVHTLQRVRQCLHPQSQTMLSCLGSFWGWPTTNASL